MLPEEEIKKYIDGVDSYTIEEIEKELSVKVVRAIKSGKDVETPSSTKGSTFTFPAQVGRKTNADENIDEMGEFLSGLISK